MYIINIAISKIINSLDIFYSTLGYLIIKIEFIKNIIVKSDYVSIELTYAIMYFIICYEDIHSTFILNLYLVSTFSTVAIIQNTV